MKRTDVVTLDEDFEYVCDVTKSWVDQATGRRCIRGVASGIAEDRAGERVSTNAIRKMAATPLEGGTVALTSSHDQDWLTEFGTVDKLQHDPETDELIYEASLPPEGQDPIADKAWRALTVQGQKLGVSIGGKLRKAFYELVDGPGGVRKRKVLDEVGLRHLALTKKPCYSKTFAAVVAKTWDAEAPADDAFVHDVEPDEPVAKAAPPADDQEDEKPDPGPDAPASDESPDGDTPAEDAQAQPAAATGTTDAQDAQDLPMAKHLSCPNCGHEFAAPMDEQVPDDSADDKTPNEDDGEARKSHPNQEDTVDISKSLDQLRTLAAGEPVEKKEAPVEVAKTDVEAGEPTEVEKMLAASHAHNGEAIAKVAADTSAGFELVAKTLKELIGEVRAMPQGRKSVARILPERGEVEKTGADTETIEDKVAKTDNPVDALKALNEHTYGIR